MRTRGGDGIESPDNRPRLVVVLPLVLVCFAVIYLLIRDGLGHPNAADAHNTSANRPPTQAAARRTQPGQDQRSLFAARRTTVLIAPGANAAARTNEPAESLETAAGDRMTSASDTVPARSVFIGSIIAVSRGSITGKIFLTGTPPAERELPLDPACGQLHTNRPTTRLYIVNRDGGLADAFVYLKEGLGEKKSPPPADAVLLDQVGCEYVPYVLGLQTKQKLLVRNSDPFLHNVHAMPAIVGNKERNLVQLAGSKDLEFAFERPEIFLRFKCDVHPWMFAYAGVVDHPFYSVSAEDGTFALTNVPPGNYVVEVFHRKAGTASQSVTIGSGEFKTVNFTLQVPGGP